jgi:hypothetical protein
VEQLWQLQDEEIQLYLLQIIQTLRFEPYHDSPLARFVISRALQSRGLGHAVFWGLRSSMEAVPIPALPLDAKISP